ncbi:MAG: AAA family ATPase [Candidatus Nitrosopolaris sp.]|jgi:MoxR-like ATPase
MKFSNLFSKLINTHSNALFDDIVGYKHIKRLLRMALDSDSAIHILLVGPPASAKTMFLTSLMHHVKDTYFADGANSTKAGMIDYLFANRPRYLLVDEIDKMSPKDQTFLLNLMGTGIVTETKYGKTRSMHVQTSVFATCNDARKISTPLQSRFFTVKLQAYTYEQFCEITKQVLSSHNVDGGLASVIAGAVWNDSRDIRDCVKIGKLAGSEEDVDILVNMFQGYSEGVT